jgi:hypothetical protein
MVVPEIELMQIPAKVSLADVVISAVNAAFQDREETLGTVRVNIALDVLFGGMRDRLMRGEAPAEPAIDLVLIRMQPRFTRNRAQDDRADRRRRDVRDMVRAGFAAALD